LIVFCLLIGRVVWLRSEHRISCSTQSFFEMLERKISSHMQISGNTPVLCRKNGQWLQAGGWLIAAAGQIPQITLSKAPDILVKLR